jgi:hypothetical protein
MTLTRQGRILDPEHRASEEIAATVSSFQIISGKGVWGFPAKG